MNGASGPPARQNHERSAGVPRRLMRERPALPPWAVALAGFLLFRLFDIVKPIGIRRVQNLTGGWGVVVDDLAAALLTCAVLHAIRLVWIRG